MPDSCIHFKTLESVFDALCDVVFFVKDNEGRYSHANLTLIKRVGMKHREDVIGRTVAELFPGELGHSYGDQDRRVLSGESIQNLLEVHLFLGRKPGWCITQKEPLIEHGRIIGLIGISRDLGSAKCGTPRYGRIRAVMTHLQQHYAQRVRVPELARIANVSAGQLTRLFHRVFQLTPQQMLTKLRIEAAMRALDAGVSVAEVALSCGFADQSSFTRQFRTTTGMTPRAFRCRKPLDPR